MKDNPRQQFRWAPHVSGTANAKPKDYEPAGNIEAENEYAAWAALRGSETPLLVGDLLELESGQLRVCKYVGFEEARWVIPETHAPGTPVPESSVTEPVPGPQAPQPAQA
jgi:hypothetical protein